MFYSTKYDSPVGRITLAADGAALNGLWIEGQKYFGDTIPEEMTERGGLPVFDAAKAWLDRYFAGKAPLQCELPLAPIGGPFRQSVWKILCEIPYGGTITYGSIAKRLAAESGKASMSAQAVGGAVGRNPISIIIPCHRVVGASGSLTGYAGGIRTKVWLLTHEGVNMENLTVPKKGTAL